MMEHPPSTSPIDPAELWRQAKAALELTGLPQWPSPEPEGDAETLVFLESDQPTWVLAPLTAMSEALADEARECHHQDDAESPAAFADEHDSEHEPFDSRDDGSESEHEHSDGHNGHCGCDEGPDLVAVSAEMAGQLIKSHFRAWLAERGWQVQLSLMKGRPTWRLADCLSFAEGGGDRLDDDYPHGDDELDVLCASVLAVGGAAK